MINLKIQTILNKLTLEQLKRILNYSGEYLLTDQLYNNHIFNPLVIAYNFDTLPPPISNDKLLGMFLLLGIQKLPACSKEEFLINLIEVIENKL